MTYAYSHLYLFIQLTAVSRVCLLYWTQLCKATGLFCLIPAISTSSSTYHWEGGGGKDGPRNETDGWMDVKEEGRRTERMEEGAKEDMWWKRKKPSSGLWTPSLLFLLIPTPCLACFLGICWTRGDFSVWIFSTRRLRQIKEFHKSFIFYQMWLQVPPSLTQPTVRSWEIFTSWHCSQGSTREN